MSYVVLILVIVGVLFYILLKNRSDNESGVTVNEHHSRKNLTMFFVLFILGIVMTVLSLHSYFGNGNSNDYVMYAGLFLHGISMLILAKVLVKRISKILTFILDFIVIYPISLLGMIMLGGPYGEFGALVFGITLAPFILFSIIGIAVIVTSRK